MKIELNYEEMKKHHIELSKKINKEHNGKLSVMTIFVYAVLNRYSCLTKAFINLMNDKNFVSAAPLIRLQLDNILRFSACGQVKNAEEFAMNILEGKLIRDMKDRYGKKMNDKNLVKWSKNFKGLERIEGFYKETCGYVHLSDKHIFNSFGNVTNQGKFEMKISGEDKFVPDIIYEEAISASRMITILLFDLVDLWIEQFSDQVKTNM